MRGVDVATDSRRPGAGCAVKAAVAKVLLETVYVLSLFFMLIVGIANENWWLFAPAAFLLIYERLGER